MQVQQSLFLMRQAFATLFRPTAGPDAGRQETGTFGRTEETQASASTAATTATRESRSIDGPGKSKGAAPLPPGVVGFIAERFKLPASTLGLPRGYFIDIQV